MEMGIQLRYLAVVDQRIIIAYAFVGWAMSRAMGRGPNWGYRGSSDAIGSWQYTFDLCTANADCHAIIYAGFSSNLRSGSYIGWSYYLMSGRPGCESCGTRLGIPVQGDAVHLPIAPSWGIP